MWLKHLKNEKREDLQLACVRYVKYSNANISILKSHKLTR